MGANGEFSVGTSERLGHASIVLTLDTYSHVLPDVQHAATEKLEKLLFSCNQAVITHIIFETFD